MKHNRALSFIMALLMLCGILQPSFLMTDSFAAASPQSLATVFSGSDFQGNSCYKNFEKMLMQAKADGFTKTPDAILFGGDYSTTTTESPEISLPKITNAVRRAYPEIPDRSLVYVQGNHDPAGKGLAKTGLIEFDHFLVYALNEDDYCHTQSSRASYDDTVKYLAQDIAADFDKLVAAEEDRPVIMVTHVPLHHNSRHSYGDNIYSKYLFDTLNEYGKKLDIVFMYGHNHSGNYDDYIGGSVNYLAKGENIRIPIPDTKSQGADGYTNSILNFTYMNCGYPASSANADTGTSTNVLTMGALEICNDEILVSRYAMTGKYGDTKVINRINPAITEPFVKITGPDSGIVGSSGTVYGNIKNFRNPTYSWTSSSNAIVHVDGAGKNAQLYFKKPGTAKITLEVTEGSVTVSKTLSVTVTKKNGLSKEAKIFIGNRDVSDGNVSYYNIIPGEELMLGGYFQGFTRPAKTKIHWTSSNPQVAEVNNGLVTFKKSGETTITYEVRDGSSSLQKKLHLYISESIEPIEKFQYTTAFEAGKSYVIANSAAPGIVFIMNNRQLGTTSQDLNRRRLGSGPVEVRDAGGIKTIEITDKGYVWNAVNEGGSIYIRNAQTGQYLQITSEKVRQGTARDLTLTDNKALTGTKWHKNANGYLVVDDGTGICYSGSGNNFRVGTAIDEQVRFEKVPSEPAAYIEYEEENADGTEIPVYSAKTSTVLQLKGVFYGFFKGTVNQGWSSDNPRIASVDEKGLVSFTGEEGKVNITYKVSDAQNAKTSSVTLDVKGSKETSFQYTLTKTLRPDKTYIISGTDMVGTAAIMHNVESVYKDSYCSNRLTAGQADIKNINGIHTIEYKDPNFEWNTVENSDGKIYLRNAVNGKYLQSAVETVSGTEKLNLNMVNDMSLPGTTWTMNEKGKLVADNGYSIHYSSSSDNFRADGVPESHAVFEKVTTDPSVSIMENTFAVDGTEKTIYSVIPGKNVKLRGVAANFGKNPAGTWISSDPSVADVKDGIVTFKGTEGIVDITYAVTDEEGNTASASVRYVTKMTKAPTRAFKLTDKILPGKNYVIANSNIKGASYVMTNGHSSGNDRLNAEYAVIQNDTAANEFYIEIPDGSLKEIWTTEKGSNGHVYIKSAEDGSYLWASASGSGRIVSTTLNKAGTPSSKLLWNYVNPELINQEKDSSTSVNTGIRFSSGINFRCSKPSAKEHSEIYIYEETELNPFVHIRSQYVNIENKTAERSEVCAHQTENLIPVPVNFPNAAQMTYTWSSDNDAVAKVDPETGVVTYTGKPGNVNITLKAKSLLADEKGRYPEVSSSTTLSVKENGVVKDNSRYFLTTDFKSGEFYIIANSRDTVNSYAVGNESYFGSSSHEIRMFEKPVVLNMGEKVYIDNQDSSIVWQCIDCGIPGKYHLKNLETGEYLALVIDGTLTDQYASKDERVITGKTLTEYNPEAYQIYYDTANNSIFSNESFHNGHRKLFYADGYKARFRLSSRTSALYLYQRDRKTSETSLAQIRVDSYNGNRDITNVMQNRYNIYNGKTEQLLAFSSGIDNITNISWSSDNDKIASVDKNGLVTYTGEEGFVSVYLTVTGMDVTGQPVTSKVMTTIGTFRGDKTAPTENYPEYPHEGSVRIDKEATGVAGGYNFQTSGVTEVELAVTGVPMSQPVDVVIVFDHSSSMNSHNKLMDAIADTRDFAMQLVHKNEYNRIAIVTFDRYRECYSSLDKPLPDFTSAPDSLEDKIMTGDGTPEGAFMTIKDDEELIAQIDSLQYNATPGTNYDFGLKTCYQILKASENDPRANKKQYVIFMSDGTPYMYNRLAMSYNKPGKPYEAWLSGDETNAELKKYLDNPQKYPVADYFHPDGDNWYADALKAPKGAPVELPKTDYYDGYRIGVGARMFTIGYGAGEPGSLTSNILERMASRKENFYYAQSNLQEAYDRILKSIIYAASDAVVTDEMGEKYNLQFAQEYKLGNGMANIKLDPAPYIEVGSWTLNSDGKRNEYTVHEKITFATNPNGNLTAAYSDLMGNTNIYNVASNKIVGKFVTYDVLSEVFTWNIGDIGREEVTLKYYAYLEGSAEGEREAGLYDTNKQAVLDYNNYRNEKCQKVFPVPSLGWKQAAINYEFYFVNAEGQPVNTDGVVVPFSERVAIGNEQTKLLLLNSTGEATAYKLIGNQEIPEGYTLYNHDAAFSVAVSSGDNPSRAEIIDSGKKVVTTYFHEGNNYINENGELKGVNDYTNTHVSFAVVLVPGIIPDSVVIDYGIPVKISVVGNDVAVGKNGTVTAIGTALKAGTVINNKAYTASQMADGTVSGLKLPHGTAEISGNQVIYTPSDLEMSREDVFYYEYLTKSGQYFYTTITVIPAANIYYEDSFIDFKDGQGYTWKTAGAAFTDKYQAEDRPGNFAFSEYDRNNVYGRDQAYDDSFTYSLGSAKYTSVDPKSVGKEPTAEFTFCGTGFDLFSVTNNDTGAVLVTMYKTDGSVYKNYIVQTYYGYKKQDGQFVPDPENGGCLYQIPVISARDLGYDTYKVVIKPIYSKVFDMKYDETGVKENSYDIYVDSVRIYDPAGVNPNKQGVIGEAYLDDGEYAPDYMELRNNMILADKFYSDIINLDASQYTNGAVFIDGNASLDDKNGLSDEFTSSGPNNEVYLKKGQAIAFHITSDTPLNLAGFQLGMKVVNGNNASLSVMNSNDRESETILLSGAHEMYRRLNNVVIWDQDELTNKGIYKTKYPIIIVNTSDALVSLTQFKWGYTREPISGASGMSLSVTSDTPSLALMSVRSMQLSEENDGIRPLTDSDINVSWSKTVIRRGERAILRITTPLEAVKVTIGNTEIKNCRIDERGRKVWTYSFVPEGSGGFVYMVKCFDEDDVCTTLKTSQLTVTDEQISEPTTVSLLQLIVDLFNSFLDIFRGLFR